MKKKNEKHNKVKKDFNSNIDYLKVSPSKRLFAYLIDHIVLVLLYAIPMQYIYSVITQKKEMKITLDMFELPYALIVFGICLLISFYYLIYSPVYKHPGTTLGKRALGIKVVKNDGSDVELKTMLIRQGIGVILLEGVTYPISNYIHSLLSILIKVNIERYLAYGFGAITIISILYALFNKDHAMFHDRIAKTKVILTKE
ncbi:RDD family protein [Clostridium sp.]|uniref:RDD family protein n=1 Tax=Clostridium sp. TaxID=1506 RepID=UPI0026224922|nr:RDD family protein [Clostridium sp.]